MHAIFGGRSTARLALAWLLLALVPAAQAQSAANLGKHERKIHKELERFPAGTYVNLELRDGSDRAGLVGQMAPSAFTLIDSDSNAQETHSYSEVLRVTRSREFIGEGSGSGHHFRAWVPVVMGVVAAGAATAFALR
jgi:hypothetical protein